ncbi:MAG: T9SS type A sorting domain-containing protein [Bacteroidia bacterium]
MTKVIWADTIHKEKNLYLGSAQYKIDTNKNVYIFARFINDITFSGQKKKLNLYSNKSADTGSIYLAKIDSSGNYIWARSFDWLEYGSIFMSLDNFNNIYLTGSFTGTIDFDPGIDTFYLRNGGAFILKLDESGNFVWAKSFNGSISLGAINTENSKNLLFTGSYNGTVDLNPGSDTFNLRGRYGSFYLKLTSLGDFVWAKKTASYLNNTCKTDLFGNIYFSGEFFQQLDFDPGPGEHIMTPAGKLDDFNSFILKLDSNGIFKWAKQTGGMGYGMTSCLANANGDVWILGYFSEKRDFDPGPDTYLMEGHYFSSGFVCKLDASGNFLWAKKLIDNMSQYSYSASLDLSGNIYITGEFFGKCDFDPGIGVYNETATDKSFDIFILKLDATGNFVWVEKIGGKNDEAGTDIKVDESGNIYLVGYFADTVYNDTIYHKFRVYNNGTFIHKMSQDAYCSDMSLVIDSVRNVSCALGPGYISAKVLRGKEPYKYEWNTTPVIKTPQTKINSRGQYTLFVNDSNGCSRNTTVIIKGPLYNLAWDIGVNLMAGRFRPGRTSSIILNSVNEGCIPLNGELTLELDSLLTFKNAFPYPDKIVGKTLTWNYKLLTADSLNFSSVIEVASPVTAKAGDSVSLKVSISPFPDSNPSNNIKSYRFPIVNSYDPNIKSVYPQGECKKRYVLKNKPLTYTIQFQNTGTAEAIDIFILDTLDHNLKINSLRVISQSHPKLITEIHSEKIVKFRFDNINLPDSSSNEPGSHGYVVYEIYPDSMASNENTISGKAGIYFDFNEPVFTNYVTNTLTNKIAKCPAKVDISNSYSVARLNIYPNPNQGRFTIELPEAGTVKIFDVLGEMIYSDYLTRGISNIDISNYPRGVYVVEANNQKLQLIKSE